MVWPSHWGSRKLFFPIRRPANHGRPLQSRPSMSHRRVSARIGRASCVSPYTTLHDGSSPGRTGGRTQQRIKARLLFIAQGIVEFHERGSHGLHCAKRGVEPLLHRLDPTRGGQCLVARATDLKAFRRLDGGTLQFVERGPLHRRGLDRLADAVDRQIGGATSHRRTS